MIECKLSDIFRDDRPVFLPDGCHNIVPVGYQITGNLHYFSICHTPVPHLKFSSSHSATPSSSFAPMTPVATALSSSDALATA